MANLGREEKNTYPHPSGQQRRSLRETWPGVPILSFVRPSTAFTETPFSGNDLLFNSTFRCQESMVSDGVLSVLGELYPPD
jgi:hypothetical protein